MVHTHGQVKFHGPTQPGTFQTGKAEVITFWSAHHFEETGVLSTRDELVDDGILATNDLTANSIVIAGVTYALDDNYDSALAAQHNFMNLTNHFASVATVVSVRVGPGVASTTDIFVDFANLFLGVGTDTFGDDLVDATGLAWYVEIVLEQKGTLFNSAGTTGFVKGEPSIGATGDNFGSSVADVEEFLNGLVLYSTGVLAIGGDNETMVFADLAGTKFTDGFNIADGTATAFSAGNVGDQVFAITNADADEVTSATIVVNPMFTAQDLQS